MTIRKQYPPRRMLALWDQWTSGTDTALSQSSVSVLPLGVWRRSPSIEPPAGRHGHGLCSGSASGPRHESRLTDLLRKATSMPVVEAVHGMAVQHNHAYVIPPNTNL